MHRNNFDFLRLLFATLVLITHSYSLTGIPENDFLSQWTGGQINCSSLGVKGFFIISGFLIFQSVLRSKNWFDYMIKRILRIYPAYIVVLLVGILVGLAVTDMNVGSYFSDPSTRQYLIQNLAMFLPLHYQIDHVFSTNIYKYAINGSIWTIPYEFLFYIILSLSFIIRSFRKLLAVVLIAGYVLLFLLVLKYEGHPSYYFPKETFELHLLAHLALCFFGGGVLALIKVNEFRFKLLLLITALILCFVFVGTHNFYFTQFVVLPVIVVLFGTYATKGIADFSKKTGDFSYGIYLYGFLVQQTLMHFFSLDHLQLMFMAIPLTFILGAASWHLVEKRALLLKKYFP